MARRVLIVTLLLLLSALCWAPDLRRAMGHPLGITGVSVNYDAVVTAVDARAAASGIRVGDRFDLARASNDERMRLAMPATADAGTSLAVPLLRGGTHEVAHLTTYPEQGKRIAMLWMRDAAQLFIVLLGALVVLRRPSPATWGIFFFLFVGCGPVNDAYLIGPHWWRIVAFNLFWLVANNFVGAYGAVIFALYLLHDGPLPRWRRVVEAGTYVLAAAMFCISVLHANMLLFSPRPDVALWILYVSFGIIPFFAPALVLIATYFESGPNLRERLRWIIGGFLLSALCFVADSAGSQGNLGLIQTSYVTHSLLVAGEYVFVAVPVAYAVLKHHIIDVNVAISRATVYTALSVAIVGLFALVDMFFTQALDQKSAGLIADIGLALVLGFSFNTMHRRVDGFVDRFLFRKRHMAEEHIRAVSEAMGFARSEEHVRTMLTVDPVRAFGLTNARIFAELGAATGEMQTLAAYLESHRGAVRLTDGQWDLSAVVYGDFVPALAVPVLSHRRIDAVAMYGLHVNGTDLDAEEIALLERLCAAAGSAFDRLESEQLRAENELLRGMARA